MRRLGLCAFLIVVAAAASAGSSHFLDRNGVLWNASSQPEGLVLTAERDEEVLTETTIPFDATALGAGESDISVAADELTGKVTVVWQRTWSPGVTDIMLGVWANGAWERVVALSANPGFYPRFPAVQLSQIKTTAPDPANPSNPYLTTIVSDSFLHVVWWTGWGPSQHGVYALVRLTAPADDSEAITTRNLDDLMAGWAGCPGGPPETIIERPLFASQAVSDRAFLFHGSRHTCVLQLLEISFRLEDPPAGSGTIVTAQRKRHTPVFGVRKIYGLPAEINLEGARIVVGDNLVPVAYRVSGSRIEYVSARGVEWSSRRTLPTGNKLSLDQAIPLIEHLAR